ncbi:hypothetical protein M0R04_14885 [Candidatus Dojkabacteria bacterium]|jgi:hypothetical protein|nr:hypothetical protein [Candidatus Dojkabacteria bacterium]
MAMIHGANFGGDEEWGNPAPSATVDILSMKIQTRAEEEFERLSNIEGENTLNTRTLDDAWDVPLSDDEFNFWSGYNQAFLNTHFQIHEEELINPYAGKMRVENVTLDSSAWTVVTTKLETEDKMTGKVWPLKAQLCEITESRVLGYIPSKTLNTGWNEFMMMFYINETLPDAARPFKKKMYAMWAPLYEYETLLYDINTRLFMDQIETNDGFVYFFIFGEDEYDSIIAD